MSQIKLVECEPLLSTAWSNVVLKTTAEITPIGENTSRPVQGEEIYCKGKYHGYGQVKIRLNDGKEYFVHWRDVVLNFRWKKEK